MDLISLKAIDDFLLMLDKKKCPWCDGNQWAMRVVPEAKIDSTEDIYGLRSLPHFRLYKENDILRGSMSVGTENALPVVVVRCDECGYIYLFDYFRIVELSKARNNPESGEDDE